MGNNDNRNEEEGKTRLNKFISHNSRFSRREADELIKAGKIAKDLNFFKKLSSKVCVICDEWLAVTKPIGIFFLYNNSIKDSALS